LAYVALEYNSAGTFLTSISSNVSHPWGIAVNSSGNLYVADSYGANAVSVYTNSSAVPEPSSIWGCFAAAMPGVVLLWRKGSSTPLE